MIAAIGELLGARGVALAATECGAVRAHVERSDGELAIEVEQPDGTRVVRVVGEAQTAATVIESFTRIDVGAPLLAARAAPADPPRQDPVVTEGGVAVHAAPAARRGVQLFSALETSFGSDRTGWVGAHVGVCIMLGPVCAAGRLRVAGVAAGPGVWEDEMERRSTELLVGIDVPFSIHGLTVSPGFAAGLGQMHTRSRIDARRTETGGVRADVHLTVSFPLSRKLALDVFTAADLTQETRGDWAIPRDAPMEPLPDEPRLLVRFGVGLRYGGR